VKEGIDNQDIFYDDQDRRVFLKHLSITKKDYDYKIYSYCLMDNHVHMVIRIEKEFLSKAMQSLMVRYVHYFNTKYQRVGALVQNRFKSKNIENEKYFLEVCRYVHRNPENAGIAKTEEYEWSSYKEYIGKNKIVDKETLLHYFNNDINQFLEFTLKNNNYEYIKELAEYELYGISNKRTKEKGQKEDRPPIAQVKGQKEDRSPIDQLY
jgi:REP element-mobilizing transposase RayT